MSAVFSTLISVEDFVAETSDDWQVFDCRFDLNDPASGESQWRDAHIPGANYAHLERDLSGPGGGRHPLPDRTGFIEFLKDNHVGEDTQVVCYDASGGVYAARMWWMTRWAGHLRVAVLDGGWQAWLEHGQGKGVADQPLAERPYLDRGEVARLATLADVKAAVSGQAPAVLLDARSRERFRGEVEPIDHKKGRIPGAVNLPFDGNLDEDGLFMASEGLRDRFDRVLSDAGRTPVIAYCGSGVTAAHNVLAMVHAGMNEPALYAGSFSEWISEEANPVETG